jgi:DDE superfamily endonuclease
MLGSGHVRFGGRAEETGQPKDRHRASARPNTYVKVAGRWTYLYRAIDQHHQVIDVLVSWRRDAAAARAFFTRALRCGSSPIGDQRPGCSLSARRRGTRGAPRGTSPSSTRTAPLWPTMFGSRRGFVRCTDSKAWRPRAPSRRGMPSCTSCAAATTRLPPTGPSRIEFTSHSTTLLHLSDRDELPGVRGRQAAPAATH